MGISSVVGSAAAATSGTSAASSNASLNIGSDLTTFLSLLTTQLKNQDPTNPTDTAQFTSHLVQFAGVQAQTQTNTELSSILSALQGSQVSTASSYVGSTVEATGDQTSLSNGVAQFGYTLPSGAASATVTVKDSAGDTVYTGPGTTTDGQNLVEWNGENSFTGNTEPAGIYTVSVTAQDASGNALTATPFIAGTVSSASVSNGIVELNIGNLQIPATSVTSVTNINGGSSASSTGTGTSNTNTSS